MYIYTQEEIAQIVNNWTKYEHKYNTMVTIYIMSTDLS